MSPLLVRDGMPICDDGGGRRAKKAPRVPPTDPVTRAARRVVAAHRALERARSHFSGELTVGGLRVECNLSGQTLAYLAAAEGRLAASEWRMREAVLESHWGRDAIRHLFEARFGRERVRGLRRELKRARRVDGPPVLHVIGPCARESR